MILELDKYRLPKPKLKKPEGEYCCQRCENNTFRISESGLIHCWGCGAQMNNLLAKRG